MTHIRYTFVIVDAIMPVSVSATDADVMMKILIMTAMDASLMLVCIQHSCHLRQATETHKATLLTYSKRHNLHGPVT